MRGEWFLVAVVLFLGASAEDARAQLIRSAAPVSATPTKPAGVVSAVPAKPALPAIPAKIPVGPRVEPAPGMVGYFHERLLALQERIAKRPGAGVLGKFGVSVENDAHERSVRLGNRIPPSIGRASPVENGPWLDLEVDPTLLLGASNALRIRLGRAPSARELRAELEDFDARIAAVNANLAQARELRASFYRKTGEVPRALEEAALAPFMVEGTTPSLHDGERDGEDLDPEAHAAARIDLLTQQLNHAFEASKRAEETR